MSRIMNIWAPPDIRRRVHASVEDWNWPSSGEIVRIPGVPRPWHELQAPVLMMLSHSPWLLIFSIGNSLFAGTLTSAYQYMAG